MRLTGLDLLFWAAGFCANSILLFVLWFRGRAPRFPSFTALITLGVLRTVVLYIAHRYASHVVYYRAYWALALLDTILQFCIIYEIASRLFRPLKVWDPEIRGSLLPLLGLSIVVALILPWLASPPARTWLQSFTVKGDLFAAALMSELFVVMVALSVVTRIPWRAHVAKIAQGLGAYCLTGVFIETAHSYFGVGREAPAFVFLSHLRMTVYLACVTYWIVTLWSDEPVREMPVAMRENMFTLQAQLDYHLRELRSRSK